MRRSLSSGFSLVELLIVTSLAAILVVAAVPGIAEGLRHYRADSALETVLMQMRLARSLAVDQRLTYRVTFSASGSIQTVRQDPAGDTVLTEVEIPAAVSFRLEPGVPVEGEQAPDGFPANQAIDFNNGSVIWFRPDGSATGIDGRPCNGVIHMAVPGHPSTARAATLFGTTGRIRGWKFEAQPAGGGHWK